MDFLLTEDQKMLKTMVRDFAEKELEPIAARIDEEAIFPAESIKKAGEIGLPYDGTRPGRLFGQEAEFTRRLVQMIESPDRVPQEMPEGRCPAAGWPLTP